MPIKIKTDLEWGDVRYIKNDPDQFEHSLVGVILKPNGGVMFQLSFMGEIFEVWDFETSAEKDDTKIRLDE